MFSRTGGGQRRRHGFADVVHWLKVSGADLMIRHEAGLHEHFRLHQGLCLQLQAHEVLTSGHQAGQRGLYSRLCGYESAKHRRADAGFGGARIDVGLSNRFFAASVAQGALPTLYAATALGLRGGEYIGPKLFGRRVDTRPS